jgi:hypothetical protein
MCNEPRFCDEVVMRIFNSDFIEFRFFENFARKKIGNKKMQRDWNGKV